MTNKIILASKSEARKTLLSGAGITATNIDSKVDEDKIKSKFDGNPNAGKMIALELAKKKALAVSKDNKDAYVIGGDQTLSMDGALFNKPETVDGVKNHLKQFSGKTHTLHSGIAVAFNGEVIFSGVYNADMTVKNLSEEYINWYGQECGDKVKNSVGGYHFEGLGAQIFANVNGDYFTILGVPLIPLIKFLQEQGAIKC